MSIPNVIDKTGGYVYTWSDYQVQSEVSRIRSHSDGPVKGEIKVSLNNGKASHIHQAQYNFVSTQARKTIGKLLEERNPGPDWYAILEQMSVMTLDRVRGGEPLLTLTSGDDVKPPEYLLQPLLIKNYPTVIFGDPGSAKSTLAIIFSTVLLLPWYDNPLGLEAPEKSIRCLYLDWETDDATIQWQLTCLERGMNLGPLSISYRRCPLPLAQDLDQIQKCIDDAAADVIIIDSLGLACGGELKDAGPAIAFFGALRQLHTTALILAHTSKERMDNGAGKKSIYGSVFFEAQARSVWYITKEIDGDSIDISLNHLKSPPFQKKQPAMGIRITFDKNGYMTNIGLCEPDDANVNGYLEKMENQANIIDCISKGIDTPSAIADKLKIPVLNVRVMLTRMKKKDLVRDISRGKYVLVENRFKDEDFK